MCRRRFYSGYPIFRTKNTGKTQFSALFSNILLLFSWNFVWLFFFFLNFRSCSSVVNLHHFMELGPFLNSEYWKYTVSAFSPTCFVNDFLFMNFRSSLSVLNLYQFLKQLCPSLNLEYWKYTVYRNIFLLHALVYCTEDMYKTFFSWTSDHIRVSWICINFCSSYVPLWT